MLIIGTCQSYLISHAFQVTELPAFCQGCSNKATETSTYKWKTAWSMSVVCIMFWWNRYEPLFIKTRISCVWTVHSVAMFSIYFLAHTVTSDDGWKIGCFLYYCGVCWFLHCKNGMLIYTFSGLFSIVYIMCMVLARLIIITVATLIHNILSLPVVCMINVNQRKLQPYM